MKDKDWPKEFALSIIPYMSLLGATPQTFRSEVAVSNFNECIDGLVESLASFVCFVLHHVVTPYSVFHQASRMYGVATGNHEGEAAISENRFELSASARYVGQP
jgi:hypothetical protein